MSKVDSWEQAILKRFDGRENLSMDDLYIRYFLKAGLPRDEVIECFQLLEFEYKVPAGILRPNDKIERLTNPVKSKTPWQWLVYRTKEGDSETEVNYQLGKRMRRFGTLQAWTHIKSFGDITILDLLRAWCGKLPSRSEERTLSE